MKNHLVRCEVSGKEFMSDQCSQVFTIREEVLNIIRKDGIRFFKPEDWISNDALKVYKRKYLAILTGGDQDLAAAVAAHQTISDDMLRLLQPEESTFLTRLAAWLSSYKFGIFILTLVGTWVVLNAHDGFDPYPYGLLDLTLGAIVIGQSLFIMLSQDRSAENEKQIAVNNYKLALKNEVEITVLREKIDHIKDYQLPSVKTDLAEIKSILEDIRAATN